VDEALSVGDAKFQAKCFARLQQLKENGTSILLVTHSTEQIVTHCSSAILLNNGIQVETGEPRAVVNRYLDLLFGKEKKSMNVTSIESPVLSGQDTAEVELCRLSDSLDTFSMRPGYNIHEYRWGDGTVSILDFHLAADDEAYPSSIAVGQIVMLTVSIKFHSALSRPILGIAIKTKDGVTICGTNSEMQDCEDFRVAFKEKAVIHAKANFRCGLAPGDYFISLGVATREGEEIVPHDRRYDSIHFVVPEHKLFHGLADLGLDLSVTRILM
jgi:lipopolysaccharide transport system ATP-binding protein